MRLFRNIIHRLGGLAIAAALGVLLVLPARADDFQGSAHMTPYDEDTINYNKAKAHDAIARLQERINRGEVTLKHDAKFGYLPAVLEALGIRKSSQMLVFSKTSFQRDRISPQTPRALYFNDEVYIGFIPGSPLLEVSDADPKLGGVFYTLEQTETAKPQFARNNQCLECHASSKTMGVPGHLMRSFEVDAQGGYDLNTGISLVTHRTPMQERWGGWYVTGSQGNAGHRGNLFGKEAFAEHIKNTNHLANLTDLHEFFNTTSYQSPHSDIVALTVLQHQVHMHNYITRLDYEATVALQQYGHINYLKSIVDSFLKYLLFVEEAPLPAPTKGSSTFTADFASQGPKDKQGRSLREFDLKTRLFKYPCSYLIYSDAFAQLPQKMKDQVYQRLWDILSGADTKPEFQQIPAETRRAIREILVDTKTDLPEYWRESSKLKVQSSK